MKPQDMFTSKAFKFWVSHTAISACARCWPSACACEDERCNLWSLAPPRESRRINDFASTTQPVSPCPHGPSSPGGEGWSPNSGGLLCISSTLLGWSTHFTKSPWKNWMDVMTYHSKLGMPCSPFDTFHRLESYTKSGLERLKKTDVIFAMPWHRVCSTKQKKVRSPKHKTFLIELKYHLAHPTIGSSYHWSTVMRNKKLIHLGTETGL